MAERLRDRAQALLAEAEAEVGELEARRQALIQEREAEVAKVRERFKVRLDEIETDVKLASRLRNALAPPGERQPSKPKADKPNLRQWRPRPENFIHVFRALAEGAETAQDIDDATPISHATVGVVLNYAREEGMIRLAGTTKRGHTNAKAFRLTPQGEEFLRTSDNGAGIVSNA